MALESAAYLWMLILVPLFVYVSIRSYRKSSRWLYAFARKRTSLKRHMLYTLFLCCCGAAVVISQAGPKILHEKTSFNRSGIDIAIGLDVSKSMLAEDVELPLEGRKLFHIPNRLNRARYCALQFLTELQGERLGLYLFASKGVELIPFTNDYGYSQYIIRHVNDSDITTSGSDLGKAILYGVSMCEESNNQQVKRIILFSDGEDISSDQSQLYEAAELAARKGIKIDTIGIGTGKAVLIPIRNEEATSIVDYYLDPDGTYLRTSLVQESLEKIAHISGGHYFRITDQYLPEKLIESILSDVKTITHTRKVELAWMDLSPIFLLSALGFFIVGIFMNN